MQLTLTPDIENAITKQAAQKGVTPQQLALEGLRKLFIPTAEETAEKPSSLADFLYGYIGVLRSSELVEGGAQMSENTGNKFAQLMMKKRQQDQL